jgi:GT2 family glycosyltransferase
MPASRLAVDLIVPTYRGVGLIEPCLAALQAQSRMPERVIVVDNGASEQTARAVRAHGAEWLPLGGNAGFAAAVNAGIAASDAPLVALLNDDAVPEPGWLAALAAALEADSAIAFCASRMLFADGDGRINAAGDAFDLRGRGGYNRGLGVRDGPEFDEPRLVFGACAGAALYRRSLFADIGLFDERFFLSWEDVDLDLRALLAGHRCLYVPSAVVRHAQGASSGADRQALERRNKAILAHKCLPLPLLLPFLALMPLREAYEAHAAGEGVRGWMARVKPFASAAASAHLLRREVVPRRVSYPKLVALLTTESEPYAGPRGDSRNGAA